MDKDLLAEMQEDAKEHFPEDDKLTSVSTLAKKQMALQNHIEHLEEAISEAKRDLNDISLNKLPDAMAAIGMREFKLDNGRKVSVTPFISGKITPDKMEHAHNWLIAEGYGDIIKQTFEVQLKLTPENEEIFNLVRKFLTEQNITWDESSGVHYQTLQAWLKMMIKEGRFLDRELFNVFQGLKASIK